MSIQFRQQHRSRSGAVDKVSQWRAPTEPGKICARTKLKFSSLYISDFFRHSIFLFRILFPIHIYVFIYSPQIPLGTCYITQKYNKCIRSSATWNIVTRLNIPLCSSPTDNDDVVIVPGRKIDKRALCCFSISIFIPRTLLLSSYFIISFILLYLQFFNTHHQFNIQQLGGDLAPTLTRYLASKGVADDSQQISGICLG